MHLILLAGLVAAAIALPNLPPCSDDCDKVLKAEKECRKDFTCSVTHLRHWKHITPGCAVTACAGGTISAGERIQLPMLVCREGNWYAGFKNYGKAPKATCESSIAGCARCPLPVLTRKCPKGEHCIPALVEEFHRDTGCLIQRCRYGGKLYAIDAAGQWTTAEYADCLDSKYWRLNSVLFGADYEFTCQKLPSDVEVVKQLTTRTPLWQALSKPEVEELLLKPDVIGKVMKEKNAVLPMKLLDLNVTLLGGTNPLDTVTGIVTDPTSALTTVENLKNGTLEKVTTVVTDPTKAVGDLTKDPIGGLGKLAEVNATVLGNKEKNLIDLPLSIGKK